MNKKNTLIFTATTLIVAGYFLYKKYHKKSIKTYDKNFKLYINNSWDIENHNNNSNLELVNKEKNIYLIIYSEKKDDDISLEEYNNHTILSINNNIIKQNKTKLGQNNAIINIFPDDNINYFLYTIETNKYFHKCITASFNTSSINIDYTNSILSTLKEIQ